MSMSRNLEDIQKEDQSKPDVVVSSAEQREWRLVWRNIIIISFFYIGGVYGMYLLFCKALWTTRIFSVILYFLSGGGITIGAHRLWSHRSFKARWPLRLFLTFGQTISFQDSVINWVRNHRMHHKYTDTDADPHNATRGFFFSHVGWLFLRKHPDIKAKAHTIDMSDLWADPILRFQRKYYLSLSLLCCFVMPTILPTFWGESLWNAFFVSTLFRLMYTTNVTFLVNSAAHLWGMKPYDKNISPTDNKNLTLLIFGEEFHNYHHIFPWDYKAAELGGISLNLTKLFIDTMWVLGLAYDLKTVSKDDVKSRVERTGDGSHPAWGWGGQGMARTLHGDGVTRIYPNIKNNKPFLFVQAGSTSG